MADDPSSPEGEAPKAKAPPGWYDWDESRQAYWNGERWGEFRPKESTAQATPTQATKQRKGLGRFYDRLSDAITNAKWWQVSIGVAVVLGIVVIPALFEGEQSSDDGNATPSPKVKEPEPAPPDPDEVVSVIWAKMTRAGRLAVCRDIAALDPAAAQDLLGGPTEGITAQEKYDAIAARC